MILRGYRSTFVRRVSRELLRGGLERLDVDPPKDETD